MNHHVSAFCKQLADIYSLRCHAKPSPSAFRRLLKHPATILPDRDHDTFPHLCTELASLEHQLILSCRDFANVDFNLVF
jgi:hypothetical protein